MRAFHFFIGSLVLFSAVANGQNRIGTGQVADLYRQHCAICHGRELQGGLGGPLVGPLEYAKDDAGIARWIREGNPDHGMPAFGDRLSEPEIRALVIYILEKRQQADPASAPGPAAARAPAAAGGERFIVQPVIEDGLSTPWAIAFLPDGGFLVTERDGQLRQFRDNRLLPPVAGIPKAWAHGQGGLLEVAIHPGYPDNGWVYLGFSEAPDRRRGSTAIARGRIRDNRWTDHQWIFRVPEAHHLSTRHHFGTRIVFQDGYLFFAIGDRGRMDSAQDRASPNGRVHRIHDDGRIPDDNPFRDDPDAFPSSWTLGNRNIQGMALHPRTGDLWTAEHGPRGGDELNRIQPGRNYGWPVITHGMNYNGTPITENTSAPGMEQPDHYWTPSIAVCGITFYTGQAFPGWRDNLFAGGLASQQLHRIVIEDGKVVSDEILLRGIGRIRDVATGPDGALYLVLNSPDQIVRLVPAAE
jgi:aldose sugar dehydrogenase